MTSRERNANRYCGWGQRGAAFERRVWLSPRGRGIPDASKEKRKTRDASALVARERTSLSLSNLSQFKETTTPNVTVSIRVSFSTRIEGLISSLRFGHDRSVFEKRHRRRARLSCRSYTLEPRDSSQPRCVQIRRNSRSSLFAHRRRRPGALGGWQRPVLSPERTPTREARAWPDDSSERIAREKTRLSSKLARENSPSLALAAASGAARGAALDGARLESRRALGRAHSLLFARDRRARESPAHSSTGHAIEFF